MHLKSMASCLVALVAVFAAGCGQSLPERPSPDRAREALTAALEAWQRGEKPDELQSRSPAMHVSDPDWSEDCKLQKYRLLPGETERATTLRVKVALSMRDSRGKTADKTVAYLVGTQPAITVVREFE